MGHSRWVAAISSEKRLTPSSMWMADPRDGMARPKNRGERWRGIEIGRVSAAHTGLMPRCRCFVRAFSLSPLSGRCVEECGESFLETNRTVEGEFCRFAERNWGLSPGSVIARTIASEDSSFFFAGASQASDSRFETPSSTFDHARTQINNREWTLRTHLGEGPCVCAT